MSDEKIEAKLATVTSKLQEVQAKAEGMPVDDWRAEQARERELRNEQTRTAIEANRAMAEWHRTQVAEMERHRAESVRRTQHMDSYDEHGRMMLAKYERSASAMERIAAALEKLADR